MTSSNDQDAMSPPIDLLPAIRSRRSGRAFAPTTVPEEIVERVFQAARWAPSGSNGQPWRFVVTHKGSEAFDRLAATLRPGNAWAKDAPILFLAVVRTVHLHPDKPPRTNHHALLDLGLALGQLCVQASADGVMTHAMGGFERERAAEAMGVVEPYEVGVVMAMGYSADPATLSEELREREERPRSRLPLEAIVHRDAFAAGDDLT